MKKIYTVFTFLFIFAATIFAQDSQSDGEWTTGSNWVGGVSPDPSSNNITVNIYHDIVYTPGANPWEWNNKIVLNIYAGASLTINSDINVWNKFTFNIEPGGDLIINGNFYIKNNVIGVVDGDIYITGNLTIQGGGTSDVSGDGSIVVDGTITDGNNIIDANLISSVRRYFVVDNGNWSNLASWAEDAAGTTPATSLPNKLAHAYIVAANANLDMNTTVDSITINASTTLNINSGYTLSVTSAFDQSGTLILKSDATGTGSVIYDGTEAIPATFQRYTGANEFHYVSSPLVAAPVSGYNTNSANAVIPDFYFYDETDVNADFLYGWTKITSGNLVPGVGYARYGLENVANELTGSNLNNGTTTVAITNTVSGFGTAVDGWNLIGNPFPCNVDADALISLNTGTVFTETLYFWDDNGSAGLDYTTDDYLVYSLGGGTSGGNGTVANGKIAPGQAFFVQAENTGGNITFDATVKNGAQGTFFKKSSKSTKELEEDMRIIRLAMFNNSIKRYDESLIKFSELADDGLDFIDAKKLKVSNPLHFYSLLDNQNYVIQAVPDTKDEYTFEFGYEITGANTYTISIRELKNIDFLTEIILTDKLTNEITNLRESDYTFSADAAAMNRFELNITRHKAAETEWLGTENDDFNDETKWSNGLPSEYKDVIIPSGKIADCTSDFKAKKLIIQKGGTLSVAPNNQIETIDGIFIESDLYETGIFEHTDQTVVNFMMKIPANNDPYVFGMPFKNTQIKQLLTNNDLNPNYQDINMKEFLFTELKWIPVTSELDPIRTKIAYKLENLVPIEKQITTQLNHSDTEEYYLFPGLNILPNAFLSYLNLTNDCGWTNRDLIGSTIWQTGLHEGKYSAYNFSANIGLNGGSIMVDPFQTFIVDAKQSGSLVVNKSTCSLTQDPAAKTDYNGMKISLTKDGETLDETILGINPDQATNQLDDFDTRKLISDKTKYANIFFRASDDSLAINTIASHEKIQLYDLEIDVPQTGTYTLDLKTINNAFGDNVTILLYDQLTYAITNTAIQSSYTLDLYDFENKDRLQVVLSSSMTDLPENMKENLFAVWANNKQVTINHPNTHINSVQVYALDGKMVLSQQNNFNQTQSTLNVQENGVFIVKVNTEDGIFTQKVKL